MLSRSSRNGHTTTVASSVKRSSNIFAIRMSYDVNDLEFFFHCLRNVKVSQGYSSNIKSLVSVTDIKLVGLKSHDCHVLIQQLLSVAIRGILPDKVRVAITRLCFFFNAICKNVIDPK